MKLRTQLSLLLLLSLLLVPGTSAVLSASLKKNFYQNTQCPQAEKLVRDFIYSKAQKDPDLGAKLLRMHFHDCFVRGCDASVLLDPVGSTPAEKQARPNQSVQRFEVIDEIKAILEQACPGIVSCSDILSLATRDAVSYPFKVPLWDVLTGRRDGNVSLATEAVENLPPLTSDFQILQQRFERKDLNINDLVVLSGGHTLGIAHCAAFSTRLYNFTGIGDQDPSLDPVYAEKLKQRCPMIADPAITAELDPQSSLLFDTNYFTALVQKKGLLVSDVALLRNPVSARIVRQMQSPRIFFSAFAKSMMKMGAIEVLTGTAGEIRRNCHVVNPRTN